MRRFFQIRSRARREEEIRPGRTDLLELLDWDGRFVMAAFLLTILLLGSWAQ
jgi:hypothetical protein